MTTLPRRGPGDKPARFSSRTVDFLRAQGVELPADGPQAPAAVDAIAPAPMPAQAPRPAQGRPSEPAPARAPQYHHTGPKPSRAQRVHARRRAVERREAAYLERMTQRAIAAGHSGQGLRTIPLATWVGCAQVVADPTGRAARIHLRRLVNRTAAGAILRASLGPGSDGTWATLRTRRIAALGLALVWLGQYTARVGPWNCIVKGIPRAALAVLLRDPFDTRAGKRGAGVPAVTTLFGTHRPGAADDSGDAGYFCALRSAGLVYRQQVPACDATPGEVGPSGYTCNRYWIVTDARYVSDFGDGLRQLAAELGRLADSDAAQLGAQFARERRACAPVGPPPGPPN
jgi:hypothetical protein